MNNTDNPHSLIITKNEFIKILGIAKRTFEDRVSSGILVPIGERKSGKPQEFDLAINIRRYIKHIQSKPIQQTDRDRIKSEKLKLEADAKHKMAKASKAEFETAELEGRMYRAEDVLLLSELYHSAVRGMLTALPGRLAVDIARISNPDEAAAKIRKEISLIIKELREAEYDPQKFEDIIRERNKLSKRSVSEK